MKKKGISIGVVVVLALILLIFYTQFTLFVIQPIGAIPEGRTLLISRLNKGEFIDSADAMCERIQGGVSLFCRLAALGAVGKNATVYARLPHSETLYLISTDGKIYGK